jgi:Luciferase-like monooxygenase
MRSGLFVPLFDELADPGVVARLSAEAEETGWDGVFVWDRLRWQEPVVDVADPWITLAVIATSTERIRLGPMVTPLARRRPAKVARETATLDRLSGGRLTLGVGLGSDRSGAISITGEELDERRRARMLEDLIAAYLQASLAEERMTPLLLWAGLTDHLQRMHRREVQHHPGARRAPSEVVPSAPYRDLDTRATRERDRLGHVRGRPAKHYGAKVVRPSSETNARSPLEAKEAIRAPGRASRKRASIAASSARTAGESTSLPCGRVTTGTSGAVSPPVSP